ncbi:MAG: phenylalanine--tRNA ligase subunit beta [Candidatus Thermoplasmatota archaeon]|nr:phenylalanine--tRNA ligase subunit beta [Candidatus Thermoplasmatota archaeon]
MVTLHIPLERFLTRSLSLSAVDEGLRSIGCSVEKDGIEINPNRPDLFSRIGIERALNHYFFRKLVDYSAEASNIECYNEEPHIRPFIACAVIRGVKLDDENIKEIIELQEMLHLTLGRNRRFSAIGLHDLSKVSPPFYYRGENESRRFVPLGSNTEMSIREILDKSEKGLEFKQLIENDKRVYPLLEDSKGNVLSMPPIINGNVTALTDSTKDLFIDVTGLTERVPATVINLLVCDLLDRFKDAKAEKVRVIGRETGEYPGLTRVKWIVNLREAEKITGIEMSTEETIESLEKMGHRAYGDKNEKLQVEVPCYRSDIMHPYDIFEEIAIGYGYDRIKARLPEVWTQGKKGFRTRDILREIFAGMGFLEVTTLNLASAEEQQKCMGLEKSVAVEILNPVSNLSILRFWIIPSLLSILRANKHNPLPQRVFECDQLYDGEHAACLIESTSADFKEIKSVAEAIFRALNIEVSYVREAHPSFIKGRCAVIVKDDERVGIIGELHPSVLRNFQLETPVCALELWGL